MASKTDISNMALGHIGVSKTISNVDTDSSKEARAIRTYYEVALQDTLSDLDWPFARSFKTLTLVEEDPTDEWAYSYSYPSDAVKIRKIYSGVRNDTRDSRVPFNIYTGAASKLIYTDQASAKVKYTKEISDTSLFDPTFVLAFSYKLAYYVIPTLSGGDPFKMKREIANDYELHIDRAERNVLNEEQADKEPESSLIRARE